MDYLDPQAQRRHSIMLLIGYVFIGFAILIGTVILLYQAYGFGLGKNGQVVQNGLVFVSSTPSGAQIRLNGILQSSQTNARLSLVSGSYNLQLSRNGYADWQRPITVEGSSVVRYDYPFLFPKNLTTAAVKTYDAAPPLVTQSPDRRWLLVQLPADPLSFELYDMKSPKYVRTTINVPAALVSDGKTSAWNLDEWSNDNQHVVLTHSYDDKTEYIELDRTNPSQSVNLNQTLDLNPAKLSLVNKKYDQFYAYDASTQILSTVSLGNISPVTALDHVLDYKSYGDNVLLYVSSAASSSGKVAIDLKQDGKTYNLREFAAGGSYVIDLAQYSGDWYVALGASADNRVFVLRNPVSQINGKFGIAVPIAVLKVDHPDWLQFSANTRFIAAEHGSQFGVYDAEYDKQYDYDTHTPLDQPQPHAGWMDGHRLTYVSGGKLLVLDYDNVNQRILTAANPMYLPFFTTDYKYMNSFTTAGDGKTTLSQTPLRIPSDL